MYALKDLQIIHFTIHIKFPGEILITMSATTSSAEGNTLRSSKAATRSTTGSASSKYSSPSKSRRFTEK